MIGKLPSTLEDRCIPVRLQRRRPDEDITQFRFDRSEDLDRLSRMSTRWAADNLRRITDADPEMPNALRDRVADNWRPLLAIADVAGGKWPKLARKVAVSVSTSKRKGEEDPAVMLLEDIYAVTRHSKDQLPSSQLAADLARIDGRPWAEWKGGQPITSKAIANLLAPFDITPAEMRSGLRVLRGYRIGQFEDAFARYVTAARSQPANLQKLARPRSSGKTVTRTVAV